MQFCVKKAPTAEIGSKVEVIFKSFPAEVMKNPQTFQKVFFVGVSEKFC